LILSSGTPLKCSFSPALALGVSWTAVAFQSTSSGAVLTGDDADDVHPPIGEGHNAGVPIVMPKGSVVLFTHGVWHWQGDRTEPGDRVTLHAHFNRGKLHAFTETRRRAILTGAE